MFSRNDAGKLYFTPTRNVKYNAFHKSRRIARSARLNRPTNTTVRPGYNIVSSGFFFSFWNPTAYKTTDRNPIFTPVNRSYLLLSSSSSSSYSSSSSPPS